MAQSQIDEKSDVKSEQRQKSPGKLKDTLSLASTALPIAGAVGTLGVWLAATFYVGDVQITPDRPFNTLEVRVSDKKGQESVFHTPHFQLMPGRYHLEVTVDSQFKQHADVKAVFRKNIEVPVHVPSVANVSVPNNGANAGIVNATNTEAKIGPGENQISGAAGAPNMVTSQKSSEPDGAQASDSLEGVDDSSAKRHWWQIWKKNK